MKEKDIFELSNETIDTLVFSTKDFKAHSSNGDVSLEDYIRYYRGVYPNRERFVSRFIEQMRKNHEFALKELRPEHVELYDSIFIAFLDEYDRQVKEGVPQFSYEEAFAIENEEFQRLVFTSINVAVMVSKMDPKKVSTDGYRTRHKRFSHDGELIEDGFIDNIYEVYEVDGKHIGLPENEKMYAVKCWCTSTEDEHWLWIDEQFKNDPLSAIASTFHIHENLIPHIKEIKRQGDVLLTEMKKEVKPEGDIVPLTKDQYFGLLTSQS